MDLLKPVNVLKEKMVWISIRVLLGLCCLLSMGLISFLFFQKSNSQALLPSFPLPKFDSDRIGRGGLSLFPIVKNIQLEPLVHELSVMGKNTRPDIREKFSISLKLKSSGETREISCGEYVFLEQQDSFYKFSDQRTDVNIVPLYQNGEVITIRIEKGSGNYEDINFSISTLFQPSMDDELYVQSLKRGKLWPADMFLQQRGGEDYGELASKSKMEIENKIYFLARGEMLWWDGTTWQTGNPDVPGAPLAKLQTISGNELQLEVWDSTGYGSTQVSVPLSTSSNLSINPDKLITSVKPRAASEVTCQLGKRRIIAKEGDWWVKTDRRWRPLKTVDDLEAFLYHQIVGELFIFEKVENSKGKVVLKGRLFNKTRSESQSVSMVVNVEKKQPSYRKSGNPSSYIAKHKMTLPALQHTKREDK